MSDSTTSKMITLKSSNGEEFVVPETVAKQSQTIRHFIEDGLTVTLIPLPNVNTLILAKVIEYCWKHADAADVSKPEISAEELRNWDKQFVDHVDQESFFDLIKAAEYLNIEGLLECLVARLF